MGDRPLIDSAFDSRLNRRQVVLDLMRILAEDDDLCLQREGIITISAQEEMILGLVQPLESR